MTRRESWAKCLLLPVLIVACSSNDAKNPAGGNSGTGGSGAQDSGAETQLRAFCTSVAAAAAARLNACHALPLSISQGIVGDLCAAWGPSVENGKMAFDATSAAACVADIQAAACDAESGPASCDRALSGLVKDGDACNMLIQSTLFFSECSLGATCIAGNSPCQGTCVKRALLNQACGSNVRCVSGETCSAATTTCTLKGASGAACGLDSSPECQPGYACSNILDGTCTALLAAGGTCSNSSQCTPPLLCNRGASLTGTCTAPLRVGDPCTVGSNQCLAGFEYCGADGKCHASPGLGQACPVTDGEGASCAVGTCDAATSVCKPIAAGQICDLGNADCGPGALCAMDLTTFSYRCTAACLP